MTNKDFEILLNERLGKIRKVLAIKQKEYATDDRLHNFRVAARIMNVPLPQALWGMAMKHLVSIIDIIEGRIEADYDEKIGDMINYLILLEAALKDER